MSIEVKNSEVIIKLVKEKLEKMSVKLETALSDEATRIVLRTQSGKDVDGSSFAPYTPKYAEHRKKKGRKEAPVDLTFTGNMLASIQTKVEKVSDGYLGTIYFGSALEALKARGNQLRRRFFGFSDEQVARIKNKLTER
jgi:hypothetical protein